MVINIKLWGVDGLIFLSSLVVLVYIYMTRKFKYWKQRGVMEITPIPFVGNFGDVLRMKKSAGQWLQDLYEWSSGLPYMGFYVFDRPFLLVRDPELVKQILLKDSNVFKDRFARASSDDIMGNTNLFMIKNPAWKIVRRNLTPNYTSGKLKKMFELMAEVGNDLDVHMKSMKLEGRGKDVEVKEVCAKFTTDMVATTAFGLKVNSLNNSEAEFRKFGRKVFDSTIYRNLELGTLFFMPQMVKPLGMKFFPGESEKFFRNALEDTLHKREQSGIPRGDLLDLLLELKKNQEDGPEKDLFEFKGDNLVAQAAFFFTVGFETTSSVLSFSLYELAIHPEIQTQVRNEIRRNLHSYGKVTYDMAMAMPYLDMVVSETLRKYPPLPLLDRVASMDYKVPNSNLILPKGTPIYISIYGLHQDPEYFPNPQKFDPERFSPEQKKNRKSGIYIPFGDGPHACIGLRLSLLQVKLGLIKLLSKYEFCICEETMIPMRLNPKSFLTAADGGIVLNIRKSSE